MTAPEWKARITHLNTHKIGQCNQIKKFFRADHFRQHLKHSHAATIGPWTKQMEATCRHIENPNEIENPTEIGNPITSHIGTIQRHREVQSITSSQKDWLSELTMKQQRDKPRATSSGKQEAHDPRMKKSLFSNASVPDDKLIPTEIVFNNIPFAVKKEQLVELMIDLGLPLPYAFNYHFDNGVFRGCAFASFISAEETARVIEGLDQFVLRGRILHVEYGKMPSPSSLLERELIKRERCETGLSVPSERRESSPESTNKISMAFSTCAMVDIYRTGFGKNKRYEFEYWGTSYIWSRRSGDPQSNTATSYSLYKSSSKNITLAHIRVQQSDELEIRAGHPAGGWIPRALMRITDEQVISPENKGKDLPE